MENEENTGADSQAAAGSDKVVPLAVVETIREELKSWKDIAREQQQTIQSLQAPTGKTADGGTPTKEEDPIEKAFAGMENDDVVTVESVKKIVSALTQSAPKAKTGPDPAVAELAVAMEYPEYRQVVKDYLPELLKQKPHLASAIRNSENPYLTAMDLAKTSPKYLKDQAAANAKGTEGKPDSDKGDGSDASAEDAAKKAVENLKKPGTGHEFGGAGGGLGKAHLYESMSDEDFEKRVAEVKRGKK
jgi:hypothetical protein